MTLKKWYFTTTTIKQGKTYNSANLKQGGANT